MSQSYGQVYPVAQKLFHGMFIDWRNAQKKITYLKNYRHIRSEKYYNALVQKFSFLCVSLFWSKEVHFKAEIDSLLTYMNMLTNFLVWTADPIMSRNSTLYLF